MRGLSKGAIPPLTELQAPISSAIQKEYQVGHQSGRIQYAVDHESYAYRLALDMGSASSFSQVSARGWKVAVTWAIGPSFNTKFRLVGPWKWEGSEEIMRGELYRTVTKRGRWVCELSLKLCELESCLLIYLPDDITYSGIPFVIFGMMSLVLWIVCTPYGDRKIGFGLSSYKNEVTLN
jgi:dimethylaniline monooxygenase (N-oxide forming)